MLEIISGKDIRAEAKRLGFSLCGFAQAESLDHQRAFFTTYLEEKRHAGITYLEKNLEKRLDPRQVMPEANTVIGLMVNYFPKETIPVEDNFIIARYAYGLDYHLFMKKRLNLLAEFLKSQSDGIKALPFIDSGTIQEKVWAQRCGLGWQGKNTILINKQRGSFFFIGIILTNLRIEPDIPETGHCGNCEHCIKACPTGALDRPYQLNVSRCLAYQTIETKNDIPEEFVSKQNDHIFGCDICQDACPFNHHAVPHDEPELDPSDTLKKMRKPDWQAMTEEDFNRIFRQSNIRRTGYEKLKRNMKGQDHQVQ